MKINALSNLFFILTLFGVIPITLSAFNIGREFISQNVYWFVVPLWIGVIGNSIINLINKKQKKKSHSY